MKGVKKDIMSAKNVNVSISENYTSYSKNNDNNFWPIYMILKLQCLSICLSVRAVFGHCSGQHGPLFCFVLFF